ncbi:MAG: hypothetical protein KC486_11485 [Myxococcales bacterium]|nr:hypothetical protein [Myxococcales bacterium]
MQLSHALSDTALVLTAGAAISALLRLRAPATRMSLGAAALAFAAIGAAAGVGVLRFLGLEGLSDLHIALSGLATCTAMPTLGAAAIVLSRGRSGSAAAWRLWIGALLIGYVASTLTATRGTYGLVIGALGTLAIVYAGARFVQLDRRGGALLLGGAGLVLVAGLAIGTKGSLGPFARLDLFHYLLAVANLGLAAGLARLAQRVDP